ncbi:small integral membrane protein 30-like [Lagenorhynchus albirostris]|uniref:small integral membrane protein 30-like n=1 Tax=Lagenorhynchus albirostris TaxID=27610 RepID=UPI0028E7DD7E|nr:small integral membrane protein 30-like [Lagenorhynchus albirostris]
MGTVESRVKANRNIDNMLTPKVEARDAIALLLGVVLSITGICACPGVYARKRNGQM